MTIDRHLSVTDLKLKAPGNLTPEQKAKWDSAYGPKNEAFEKANLEGDALFKWKYQRYVKITFVALIPWMKISAVYLTI